MAYHYGLAINAYWAGLALSLLYQLLHSYKIHGSDAMCCAGSLFLLAFVFESFIPVQLSYLNVFIYGLAVIFILYQTGIGDRKYPEKQMFDNQMAQDAYSAAWSGGFPLVLALWLLKSKILNK